MSGAGTLAAAFACAGAAGTDAGELLVFPDEERDEATAASQGLDEGTLEETVRYLREHAGRDHPPRGEDRP